MENQNDNTEMIKNLTNILEGLDNSQEQLEKNAFDVINSSDTSLNLVKESIGLSTFPIKQTYCLLMHL